MPEAAAHARYGRSFAAERDVRTAAYEGRTRQAMRGRVTRALDAELTAYMDKLRRVT